MPAAYITHAAEAMKINYARKFTYYIKLGIMPDAFKYLLCSKLCQHNLSRPSSDTEHSNEPLPCEVMASQNRSHIFGYISFINMSLIQVFTYILGNEQPKHNNASSTLGFYADDDMDILEKMDTIPT